MLEWVNWAAEQVDLMTQKDDIFLGYLRVHNELVDRFDRFAAGLPETERELILDYLDIVTEMEYRKTQLAYR